MKPAAAAPIATQPAAVVREFGIALSEREDDRVFRRVVRRVLLAGHRLDVYPHGRPRAERGRAKVAEDHGFRLARVDEVDDLLSPDGLRALLNRQRDLHLRLLAL